jgi:NADH-quinone oxidoreductase subunit M
MGFIVLGVFTFTVQGMSGAILQMINHGLSTGGLFLAVGMIYERRHTREMAEFGGLAKTLPVYAALTMIMVLSSVGLPGLNGFVGEFTIMLGAAKSRAFLPLHTTNSEFTIVIAALAGLGVILGAVYLLVMYQKVFWGKVTNPKNKTLADLNSREILQLVALALVAFWIGLYPKPFLTACAKASAPVLSRVATSIPGGSVAGVTVDGLEAGMKSDGLEIGVAVAVGNRRDAPLE